MVLDLGSIVGLSSKITLHSIMKLVMEGIKLSQEENVALILLGTSPQMAHTVL